MKDYILKIFKRHYKDAFSSIEVEEAKIFYIVKIEFESDIVEPAPIYSIFDNAYLSEKKFFFSVSKFDIGNFIQVNNQILS